MPRWGLKWITLKWCNKNEVIKYGEKFITSSKMKNKMKCQTRKDTNGMKIARRKFVWKNVKTFSFKPIKLFLVLRVSKEKTLFAYLIFSYMLLYGLLRNRMDFCQSYARFRIQRNYQSLRIKTAPIVGAKPPPKKFHFMIQSAV